MGDMGQCTPIRGKDARQWGVGDDAGQRGEGVG